MTDASVEIGRDLRMVLKAARKSPEKWGKVNGLTQDQAAHGSMISTTWYRNLETGYIESASVTVVANVCEFLGIGDGLLEQLGYMTVAEELRSRVKLGNKMVLDLERLSLLTPKEEATLKRILDKLAAAPSSPGEIKDEGKVA